MVRRAAHVSALAAVAFVLAAAAPARAADATVVAGPVAPPQGTTASPPAPATPEALQAAFDNAVNAFKYQDFDNAVPQLRALLYPKVRLDQKREWRVREYLGAALWWQGDNRAALDEFTALLVRNPPTHLDPAVYPPKMIADFEGLRQNLVRLGVLKADQPPRPPELSEAAPEPPFVLMLFPFGVGQFANRDNLRGAAFLVAETVLASVSYGLYLHNYDPSHSRAAELTQTTTGVAFFLVAGWGIADAILHDRRPLELPR